VTGAPTNSNYLPRMLFLGALLLVGISSIWMGNAATPESDTTVASITEGPVIPRGIGEQCVADTALMRSDHMKLLNHQRDETVIDGVRGNPFSLVGCVNCHAQSDAEGRPVRIDAEGQFCESCHAYAAVKIDCFSCHAAVPEPGAEHKEIIGFKEATDAFNSSMHLASGVTSKDLLYDHKDTKTNVYFPGDHGKR